jgi:hypothetical protein
MKYTWLAGLLIGVLPAVTFADRRGFDHFDRGRNFGHFDHHDFDRGHSHSFFGLSLNFGDPFYSRDYYYSRPYYPAYSDSYYYYAPPPVVYDEPAYVAPPVVVYPAPSYYYYSPPIVRFDAGVRYHYGR